METIVEKYIQRVERAIDFGLDQKRWRDREISIMRTKLNQSVFNINGMSTPEVRMFLNELIDDDTNYLEIGTHRGSTFVSAMYKNNHKSAIAIDDFGGPMHAPDIKNDFLKNCADSGVTKYKLIHNDSFRLKPNELESIKDIKRGIPLVNSVWDIRFIKIQDQTYDLNQIEHQILRPLFKDARIHAAINCASFSCPRMLRHAFTAVNLDQQLDTAMRAAQTIAVAEHVEITTDRLG